MAASPAPLKILRLSKSDDFVAHVPEGERAPVLAERAFCAATGLAATTVTRNIWPTPDLAELVSGWMGRHEPDLVFLKLNGFWFTYESVALKLQRRLRVVGRPMGRLGLTATPRFAKYEAFQAFQRLAVRAMGGESHFTAEEVVARVSECIRRILASESVVLTVCGPLPHLALYSAGARTRAAAAYAQVDGEIRQLCARLGVHYLPIAEVPGTLATLQDFLPDRLHVKQRLHTFRAEVEGRAMAEAWQAAHAAGEPARR